MVGGSLNWGSLALNWGCPCPRTYMSPALSNGHHKKTEAQQEAKPQFSGAKFFVLMIVLSLVLSF